MFSPCTLRGVDRLGHIAASIHRHRPDAGRQGVGGDTEGKRREHGAAAQQQRTKGLEEQEEALRAMYEARLQQQAAAAKRSLKQRLTAEALRQERMLKSHAVTKKELEERSVWTVPFQSLPAAQGICGGSAGGRHAGKGAC